MEAEIREMLRQKAAEAVDTAPMRVPLKRVRARRVKNGIAVTTVVAGLSLMATGLANRATQPVEPVGPVPKVGAIYSIEGEPTDVVFGFGSVWVTTEQAVLRIDPATGRVQAKIDDFPDGAAPRSRGVAINRIAVGPDAVWVLILDDGYRTTFAPSPTTGATGSGKGSVGGTITVTPPPAGFVPKWGVVRIDPASNAIEDSGLLLDSLPSAITATDDGVWVTARRIGKQGVDGLLAKFDFDQKTKTNTLYDLPGEPAAVVADREGLWVGTRGTDRVVKIDPRTGREIAGTEIANPGDMIIRDDEIWVASITDGAWSIEQLDKASVAPRGRIVLGSAPEDESEMIEFGSRVWIVVAVEMDPFGGALRWIDPFADGVSGRAPVALGVRQIAGGDGVLWMLGGSTGDAKLYRVDLPELLR